MLLRPHVEVVHGSVGLEWEELSQVPRLHGVGRSARDSCSFPPLRRLHHVRCWQSLANCVPLTRSAPPACTSSRSSLGPHDLTVIAAIGWGVVRPPPPLKCAAVLGGTKLPVCHTRSPRCIGHAHCLDHVLPAADFLLSSPPRVRGQFRGLPPPFHWT